MDDDESEGDSDRYQTPAPDGDARYRSLSPEYRTAQRTTASPRERTAERASVPPQDRTHEGRSAHANNAHSPAFDDREATPTVEEYTSALEEAHGKALRKMRELEQALAEAQMQCQRQVYEHRNALALSRCGAEERERELTQALSETEARLAVATNDLANLRSLTGADKADPQAFITLFDDLNDAVGEFAFRLVDDIPFGQDVITAKHLKAIERRAPVEYALLRPFLHYCVDTACQIADVLIYASQTVFVGTLQAQLFDRFAAFQDREQSQYLMGVQGWVQKEVPQEQSARWRAITYRAVASVSEKPNLAQALGLHALHALSSVLAALSEGREFDAKAPLRKLMDDATKIADMAARLHEQARGVHLLYDYDVFLPLPGSAFASREMEREDPPDGGAELADGARESKTVLLSVGLGLKASRTEPAAHPSKGAVRKTKVLKKAHVL
ncbi:hypothetical protein AURDEDRAFT_187493 [Auricularia subglabra TFB-10046 SS5]|nr:hypothetical protein AURDEDRAFT_187493 [Auricularia subglabra TFB-10046 SS5]